MSPAVKTGLKWGGIIALLAIIVYVIYYLFKGGQTWVAMAGKDVGGPTDVFPGGGVKMTLEEAKTKAKELGAKAFFRTGDGTTWIKTVTTPVIDNPGGTLYVLK